MNVFRFWEEGRLEEEDQFSKIEARVGGGSGSITTSFAFHAECFDPNCSYNHSSAELFRHHRGTLNGFFLLRYTFRRSPVDVVSSFVVSSLVRGIK
jgi:hypothetical protein